MAKKSKTDVTNENAMPAAKTPRAKSTTGNRKSAVKKTTAARKAKTPSPSTTPAINPTDEEIGLRAYFIAERRHRLDLPGDANSDWLEAKRQLLSEIGTR